MSSLHTLHHANAEALTRALAAAQPGDALLLREDAVLLAYHDALQRAPFATTCALLADLEARGLRSLVPESVQLIEDAEFVALTLQHDRIIAWR